MYPLCKRAPKITILENACLRKIVSSAAYALEGERTGTAQFAVSVRSTVGVGRSTDTLRYLHAASSLQRLL
jgi:hypothetical protein